MLNDFENNQSSTNKQETGHLSQDESIEIIPLEIESSAKRISLSQTKDPDPNFSENLRWVRDTPSNRSILIDFMIKRILISKILKGTNWSFLPCCNVFCGSKPTGAGHRGVKWNPLLFLLEEQERSKVLTFKKKLRMKHRTLSQTNFQHLGWPLLFHFIKAEMELKKLKKIIDDLPRKDGCFHLPLMISNFNDDCPGPSPLLETGAKFDFMVDLVTLNLQEEILDAEALENSQLLKQGKSKNKQLKNQTRKQSPHVETIQAFGNPSDFTTLRSSPAPAPLSTAPQALPVKFNQVTQFILSSRPNLGKSPFGDSGLIETGFQTQKSFLYPSDFKQEGENFDSKEPSEMELSTSTFEREENLEDLTEEVLQERIRQLTLLKHHKEQVLNMKKQELSTLMAKLNKEGEGRARIEEEAQRMTATL